MSPLAPTPQAFFADRLARQRRASPHTIADYRDTMRLLLAFAAKRVGKQPAALDLDDLEAPLDRRVPRPPRGRPRQQRPDRQRPSGGDPLAVSLRRAASPRTRRHDPAGRRDPTQVLPAHLVTFLPSPSWTHCSPRAAPLLASGVRSRRG
jgi:hypothetical protein